MHYPTIDNVNNTHTLATQTHKIYITLHNVRVFFFVLACHQQQGTSHTTPKAAHHNQQYPACITLTRYHHNLQKQTTTRCLEARPAQARISSSLPSLHVHLQPRPTVRDPSATYWGPTSHLRKTRKGAQGRNAHHIKGSVQQPTISSIYNAYTLPSQPTKINNDSMPGIEARTIRYLSPASSHSCSSATKTNCAQALSLFLPSKLLTNLQFVLAAIHP
jgi:hypothetical protein